MLKLGDVILFEDLINEKEKKIRPLVVLKTINEKGSFVGVRCTTKAREYDDYSYEIIDWEECGLHKPSSVRCDKIVYLNRSAAFKDNDGNPRVVAKLTQCSINKVIEHFERYQHNIASIAEEIKEATKKQTAYAIKVIETIDGKETVQYKIYDDEAKALERYSCCCSEYTRTVLNGKMVDMNTHYEFGTMTILNRNEADEQSFVKMSSTNNLAQYDSKMIHKHY